MFECDKKCWLNNLKNYHIIYSNVLTRVRTRQILCLDLTIHGDNVTRQFWVPIVYYIYCLKLNYIFSKFTDFIIMFFTMFDSNE